MSHNKISPRYRARCLCTKVMGLTVNVPSKVCDINHQFPSADCFVYMKEKSGGSSYVNFKGRRRGPKHVKAITIPYTFIPYFYLDDLTTGKKDIDQIFPNEQLNQCKPSRSENALFHRDIFPNRDAAQ